MQIQNIELGPYINEGAWGTVYEVQGNSELAVKVFKRNPKKKAGVILRIFQNEVAAHERASDSSVLTQHAPKYFGKANAAIDRETHYPELAFVMERLGAPVETTKGAPPEIADMFQRCGIKGIDDISALTVPGTTDIKYVDFSLRKYQLNQEGGIDFD